MLSKVLFLTATLAALALSGCVDDDDDGMDGALHAQLLAAYSDMPYMGGQDTPSHTWLVQGDEMIFLHWNDADPAAATGLLFVGDGFKAKGCVGSSGVSQAQIDEGYVHFHKESSPNWDQGHHATEDPATDGWWLRHIAAAPGVDPMGTGASAVGEVYPLMPSYENAPACPLALP